MIQLVLAMIIKLDPTTAMEQQADLEQSVHDYVQGLIHQHNQKRTK